MEHVTPPTRRHKRRQMRTPLPTHSNNRGHTGGHRSRSTTNLHHVKFTRSINPVTHTTHTQLPTTNTRNIHTLGQILRHPNRRLTKFPSRTLARTKPQTNNTTHKGQHLSTTTSTGRLQHRLQNRQCRRHSQKQTPTPRQRRPILHRRHHHSLRPRSSNRRRNTRSNTMHRTLNMRTSKSRSRGRHQTKHKRRQINGTRRHRRKRLPTRARGHHTQPTNRHQRDRHTHGQRHRRRQLRKRRHRRRSQHGRHHQRTHITHIRNCVTCRATRTTSPFPPSIFNAPDASHRILKGPVNTESALKCLSAVHPDSRTVSTRHSNRRYS